jgi:heme/copper-type cytochrome/quinol oxidase subunit 4
VAVQTKPQITSLIPNSAFLNIGMTAANQILHNLFCFMHFHAQNMQKSVLEKSGYAGFVLTVPRTMGLE